MYPPYCVYAAPGRSPASPTSNAAEIMSIRESNTSKLDDCDQYENNHNLVMETPVCDANADIRTSTPTIRVGVEGKSPAVNVGPVEDVKNDIVADGLMLLTVFDNKPSFAPSETLGIQFDTGIRFSNPSENGSEQAGAAMNSASSSHNARHMDHATVSVTPDTAKIGISLTL